mgnify:FL=1
MLYWRAVKLCNTATHGAYLLDMTSFFIACFIFSLTNESVSHNQPYLDKQLDGIVKGCTGNPEIRFLKLLSKHLQCERTMHVIYGIENSKPFRRFTQGIGHKILCQNITDLFFLIRFMHFIGKFL